jgi:tetratricopeptide (TPR) repeat protein
MDVDKFLVKAEQALRKRAVPQALALYKQVLVASPDHGGARAGLLAASRRKAELKGGPGMLDRAAAKTLRATAMGSRGAGQHALVVKSCEAALERDPDDLAVIGMLGDALAALDRPNEALACWQERLERDDRDVEALKAAGTLQYELKEIGAAIELLDRAHTLDPHDPEIEKLRKKLVAEGTLASTGFETAKSSRELIRDKEAVRKAETTSRLHRTADELSADIEELSARLAADPADVDVCRKLVAARMKAGDLDGAAGDVASGLGHHPEDDGLLDLSGEIGLAANKAALAADAGDAGATKRLKAERLALEIEEYGRRIKRNPGEAATRLKLGQACYKAGRTEEAIECFQVLVSDPRSELAARQGLGACFFRKGMFPLAARQFEQALASAGGVGSDRGKEICYHLGLVCERLEQTQDALARYLEIYEVDIHFKDVAAKIEALQA